MSDTLIETIDDLKGVIPHGAQMDFYLSLNGGVARSSKSIGYYPDSPKPWDVWHSISESWEEYTDEELVHALHGSDGKFNGLWLEVYDV